MAVPGGSATERLAGSTLPENRWRACAACLAPVPDVGGCQWRVASAWAGAQHGALARRNKSSASIVSAARLAARVLKVFGSAAHRGGEPGVLARAASRLERSRMAAVWPRKRSTPDLGPATRGKSLQNCWRYRLRLRLAAWPTTCAHNWPTPGDGTSQDSGARRLCTRANTLVRARFVKLARAGASPRREHGTTACKPLAAR